MLDEAKKYIPYGCHVIDEADLNAVEETLYSGWITTGSRIEAFEMALAEYVHADEAIAVSSGTAALHAAVYAAGISVGDEVIVPPITFVATANCILYQGGTPVFADVDPETLLIDPDSVEKKITPNTKAIIAVDYAGQPCDYDRLRRIAQEHGLVLIADACHSLGGIYKACNVGTLADLTVFSFHPVKHITTGEGGMITTNNRKLAAKIRRFRNHGIDSDHHQRTAQSTWLYQMEDLGFNYRLTDFQCALGLSQLRKLPVFLKRRRNIASLYDEAFTDDPSIHPLKVMRCPEMETGSTTIDVNRRAQNEKPFSAHAYHLYVVKTKDRDNLFSLLRNFGIGVNVHYMPVYWHSYYRKLGYDKGLCPVAEKAYQEILSLPIWPGLTDMQIRHVVETIKASGPEAMVMNR